MKQIEKKMIQAISLGKNFKQANTEVQFYDKDKFDVFLHSNLIAFGDIELNTVKLSNSGWLTATIRSRLNALIGGAESIYQKKYIWYHSSDNSIFNNLEKTYKLNKQF